jgi:hypothetical protein
MSRKKSMQSLKRPGSRTFNPLKKPAMAAGKVFTFFKKSDKGTILSVLYQKNPWF